MKQPVLRGPGARGSRLRAAQLPPGFNSTLQVSDEMMVTTSKDILETLGTDEAPDHWLVALGYAGWSAGQLEQELVDGAWLVIPQSQAGLRYPPSTCAGSKPPRALGSTPCTSPARWGMADTPALPPQAGGGRGDGGLPLHLSIHFEETPCHHAASWALTTAPRASVSPSARSSRAAPALRSLKANDGIPNWDEIEKLIKEWQPDLLIVGLPLNMDGTDQEITVRARKFGNRLHGRFGKPVGVQGRAAHHHGCPRPPV